MNYGDHDATLSTNASFDLLFSYLGSMMIIISSDWMHKLVRVMK
jgi:hypothetical protein